jgi:uncharacterized protein (DUF983 family)
MPARHNVLVMPPARSKLNPWTFIGRALRLRCPECGSSRIFKPWRQTRTLDDWFRTLHGCENCNYAYEREQGYFLLSIWALNYGLIAGLAIVVMFTLEALLHPPIWVQLVFVIAPMPIFSFLFARHSKALFLAVDHFCDPQAKPTKGEMEEHVHGRPEL